MVSRRCTTKNLTKVLILASCVIVLMASLSFAASADMMINEIMYDPTGTDGGHEWIEVYNSGTSSVDLSGWRLFEQGTHHTFTLIQGSNQLNGGSYAVIADNSANFLIDNPGFAGTLFDSSFSLINIGEELILENSSLDAIDIVNYSNSWGTNVEGYSLELINPTLDNDNSVSWSSSNNVGGTPGVRNSISVNNPPDVEDISVLRQNGDVVFCSTVTDDFGLADVRLHYSSVWIDGEGEERTDAGNMALNLDNEHQYSAEEDQYCRLFSEDTILMDGTVINYSVTATDTDGEETTREQDEPYVHDNAAPIAEFSCLPTEGIEPLTIECTSTSYDTIPGQELTHNWRFFGGVPFSPEGDVVNVTYIVSAVYIVELTVTDPFDHTSDPVTTMIYVNDATPQADFNYTPENPNDHQEITFDGSLSENLSYDTIAEYCWDFGDGTETYCDGSVVCTGAEDSCVTAVYSYPTFGDYDVTLTVTDVDGEETGEETKTVSVSYEDDAPIVSGIPNQTIEEGGSFTTFDLDDYLTELDGEEVMWDFGGETDLIINIDNENVVTVSTPNENWNGEETISFIAVDISVGLLSDSEDVTFTVTPVNDAPVVNGIPDQRIDEGENFTTFDLDDNLTEVDGDEIIWAYAGNVQLTVSIDGDNVVTITPPSESWDGREVISFIATDNNIEGLSDFDIATFTIIGINDLPTLNISDKVVEEDSGVTVFNLNESAADIEDIFENLIFTIDSESNTSVIDCEFNGNDLECTTQENQYGTSLIQITVEDTDGDSVTDNFTITVTPVNDAPLAYNVTANTDEDTAVNVTLNYDDVDVEDYATSCNITYIKGGANITEDCLCVVDDNKSTCTVGVTPANDSVNDIQVGYTVNDGEVDSNEGVATITVNPINDPPTIVDILNQIVTEDQGTYQLLLTTFVSDAEDNVSELIFTLDNQSNTSVIDCQIEGEYINCSTIANQYGENAVQLTVWDTEGASASDNFSFIVLSVNDLPVVEAIPNQEVVEGTDFELVVSATDVDNNQEQLFIDEDVSTLHWLDSDGLVLSATPDGNDVGVWEMELFVADGTNLSEAVDFNVTVIPALEIITEPEPRVTVNGVEISGLEEGYNVSPGDVITIDFDFKNNYEQTLGHVETEAGVNIAENFDGLPYEGVCEGVDCDEGYWALTPGDTGSDSFTFTVPYNISADDFILTVGLTYDQFFGLWSVFDNYLDLNFNVVRDLAGTRWTEIEIENENLSCMRTADLNLDLTNTGSTIISPELLIYNQKPVESSFNRANGEFDTEANLLVEETLPAIGASESLEYAVNVDLINLSHGQHTLYIYFVNPYFDQGGYFIGDYAEVVVNIGPCLDTAALEDYFVIPKEGEIELSADLRDYVINEEERNQVSFNFGHEYSEPEHSLIKCGFDGSYTLICNSFPYGAEQNYLDVILSINGPNVVSPLEETFRANLAQTLEISNVKINNVVVEEEGESTAIKPEEEISIEVTLTNHLDHSVTGIHADLNSSTLTIVDEQEINLEAGESGTITITGTLPYTIREGDYSAWLSVSGRDYNDNRIIQSDRFLFTFNIEQDAADVIISELIVEDEEGISCKSSTTLSVDIINRGNNRENDVVITVIGNDLELASEELMINPNSRLSVPYQFEIPAANLSSGNNDLIVRVSYRDGSTESSQTVSISKSDCLDSFLPTESSMTVGDGEEIEFSVNLSEGEEAAEIVWYVDDEEVASNRERYTFSEEEAGDYEVKVIINGDEEESRTWTVTVITEPLMNGFEDFTFEEGQDMSHVENFVIENSYGKIEFKEAVDLSDIIYLNEVVTISQGLVAIDVANASGLDRAAEITIKNLASGKTVIYEYDGFGSLSELGEPSTCETPTCQPLSHQNNNYVFYVNGFSTYVVINEVESDLQISSSEISFENVYRGEQTNTTFTLRNVGTIDTITGISVDISGVENKYLATVTGVPTSLAPGEEASVTLSITIPASEESASKQSIGSVDISSSVGDQTIPVYIQPRSYLTIKSVEINGKSSGDFSIEETNEIEVEVENEYTEDMEDVEVMVEILDVDGDDLDEDADEEDIDVGDDEKFTVEFDLSDEDIDEEEYTIRITVTGEAKDGTEHETVEERDVDIDIEKHNVVITRAALSSPVLECSQQTELQVTIENFGKEDEEDVVIKVKNTALGLDLQKTRIDLDKFFDSDNDYRTTFNLNVGDVDAGAYPLTIEVYRDDDKLEDSKTEMLTIKECLRESSTSQTQPQYAQEQLAQQLQQGLQQQVFTRTVPAKTATVKTSFRDSDTYMILLGVITILVFVAVVLSLVVLVARKRK